VGRAESFDGGPQLNWAHHRCAKVVWLVGLRSIFAHRSQAHSAHQFMPNCPKHQILATAPLAPRSYSLNCP